MPVSKNRRKKKRAPQTPAQRSPAHESMYEFPDEGLLDQLDYSDEALEAELDTNAAIADLKRAGKGFRPETLAAAEEVILEALDADLKGQLLDAAVRAFHICPWCGDAYGLLAMAASNHPDLVLHFRRLALAAAEFALDADWGQDLRKAYAGDYWGHVATRAYMRAASGLAETLADTGQFEEAAERYEALMALNTTDDQGLRYALANCLLLLGRDQRLAGLLASFRHERSAFVGFNDALLAFRRDGDTGASRDALADATKANRHVTAYLLGDSAVPPIDIKPFEPGSVDEAALYVECTAEAWHATPGALDWLRGRVHGAR
jgi:tetratricopeptide (TPR) repeat protein